MNRPVEASPGPPVALILLGVTVVAYVIQMSSFLGVMRQFALWPLAHDFFAPWQLISYGFLHGGIGHLFFNMFALYMFGLPIERAWGTRRFLIFYFVCMVGAGLVQLIVTRVDRCGLSDHRRIGGSIRPVAGVRHDVSETAPSCC